MFACWRLAAASASRWNRSTSSGEANCPLRIRRPRTPGRPGQCVPWLPTAGIPRWADRRWERFAQRRLLRVTFARPLWPRSPCGPRSHHELRNQGYLLIGPTALDMAGRPVKQRRIHLPGLTLHMLAAVTPEEVELRLVNETAEDIPYDKPWDLVGLTGMGSGIVRAWQIGDEFRRRGRKVVIGGIAASLGKPEWTLAHADALVIGEAEETWPQVIRDAQAGRLRPTYQSEEPPDIKTLPLPRYDLMNGGVYGRWTPVQATRGCPFTCSFCSVSAFFRHRRLAPEQLQANYWRLYERLFSWRAAGAGICRRGIGRPRGPNRGPHSRTGI